MLCCAVLCCAVLCCAVLCYAVLCCAVLITVLHPRHAWMVKYCTYHPLRVEVNLLERAVV